jgi:transcriptional regulator
VKGALKGRISGININDPKVARKMGRLGKQGEAALRRAQTKRQNVAEAVRRARERFETARDPFTDRP